MKKVQMLILGLTFSLLTLSCLAIERVGSAQLGGDLGCDDLLGCLNRQSCGMKGSNSGCVITLHAIRLEMNRMRALEKSQLSNLSATFGRLILSKVSLEVELNDLLVCLTSEHPNVKKKRVELAVLEREITNVLR